MYMYMYNALGTYTQRTGIRYLQSRFYRLPTIPGHVV